MINFTYEDGCFYCNKDDGNKIHETHIEIKTLTKYDVEFNRLQKASVVSKPLDNFICLVCSCGEVEDISNEFRIEEDYIVEIIKY